MNNETNDTTLNSIYSLLSQGDSFTSFADYITHICEERGISQRQLSDILAIERKTLQRITSNEAQKIDVFTLIKLAQFFGEDVNKLLQHYVAFAAPSEIKLLENAKKYGFILANFDLKELKKIGFIDDIKSLDLVENRIKKFFGLNSIYEFNSIQGSYLYKRARKTPSDKMLRFWMNTVYSEFKLINNPNPFNKNLLQQTLSSLRAATLDEARGLQNYLRALYECGVTVIIESYTSKTSVRGATTIIDGKPCVIITNLFKKYADLWFTLAHELYHVMFDLEKIEETGIHFSQDYQTGLYDRLFMEERADGFASELLLLTENYEIVRRYIDIEGVVIEYAKKFGVHPSIIYARYCHENKDGYKKYQKFLKHSAVATANIEVEAWKNVTLNDSLKRIEAIYRT